MSYRFNIAITKETDWYVAECIENNVASQGKTIEEALSSVKEAIELYYEDNDKPAESQQMLITSLEVTV